MKNLILLTLLASLVYGTPIVGTLGKPAKPFKKVETRDGKAYITRHLLWSTNECLILPQYDKVVCDIETIEDLPTLEIK